MRRIPAVPAYLIAALAALALPLAAPDASAQQIGEVRIYAKDLATGADYTWVNPGGTLVLPPRTEVRLRLEALPAGGAGPRYPSGRFEDASMREAWNDRRRGGISGGPAREDDHRFAGVHDVVVERGAAVLQTYGREGESAIRYTILDDGLSMPRELRTGTFIVRVDDDARLTTLPPETGDDPIVTDPGSVDEQAARRLVTELYRGILMREPEPEGLEDWSERIEDRGYPETIAVATDIARSEESRFRIYQGGTTYEQRLTALYEHLLGVEARNVPADQWREDLERLRDGEIEQVVGEIVRSPDFRERFGFPDRRFVRTRDSF